jgi:hypothetical protein
VLFYRVNTSVYGVICEVKHDANNVWYAVVQSLLQVKLARESAGFAEFCQRRTGALAKPVTGAIVAPRSFYTHAGRKRLTVDPARLLLNTLARDGDTPVRLVSWERDLCDLDEFV